MVEIERIHKMESILDRTTAAKNNLARALSEFDQLQNDLKQLSEYYGSKEFFHDLDMDEKGLLPADLKRGVLSEDGIYHLLEEIKEISDDMCELSEKAKGNIKAKD